MKIRILLFSGLLFLISHCTTNSPVDINYYSDDSRILGGLKPSAPVLNPIDYNGGARTLTFTVSIDPDSTPVPNQVVQVYYLYHYFQSVPAQMTDVAYYLDASNTPGSYDFLKCTSFCTDKFVFSSGTHYFAMTGFDGGRESDPSNVISFTIP